MNSAGQIEQLNALRCKMRSVKFNWPRAKSEEISENEMPSIRMGIPKEETYNKYGAMIGKLNLWLLRNMGLS